MSLKKFQEVDLTRWVGVRPAARGTQITADKEASNDTLIVYTVSAGKTLYLTNYYFTVYNAVGAGHMNVRDDEDAHQYRMSIGKIKTEIGSTAPATGTFNPPLEIPAGWDITVTSNAVNCYAFGFIHGWEE